jgi:hypothetical protein
MKYLLTGLMIIFTFMGVIVLSDMYNMTSLEFFLTSLAAGTILGWVTG